jgi:hypothetical protein
LKERLAVGPICKADRPAYIEIVELTSQRSPLISLTVDTLTASAIRARAPVLNPTKEIRNENNVKRPSPRETGVDRAHRLTRDFHEEERNADGQHGFQLVHP